MKKSAILLCLSLMACGVYPGEITQVSIEGPVSMAFYSSTKLVAVVEGPGSFNPQVTWFIESGGGELSAMTGDTVTYTAPLVTTETPVIIRAVSQMDASKVGTFTLTITPPPPPAEFLAARVTGQDEQWRQRGDAYGRANPPVYVRGGTHQSNYEIKQVGATRVLLLGVTNHPSGIPMDVYPDGTLSILDAQESPWNSGNCTYSYLVGMGAAPGSGTWDYKGNLTLLWSSRESEVCPTSPEPNATHIYTDHHFTAKRSPKEP